MKKIFVVLSVLALNLVSTAHALETSFIESSFLKQVHAYVKTCAVQPYAYDRGGKKVMGYLRPVCDNLKVQGSIATFVVYGHLYTATVHDSEYSDGGDLNDLVIRNQDGAVVAEVRNILSFGDVLLAMAGGDDNFAMEYDPSVL